MKRILIVDDDPLVLEMYRRALTRLGYEVDAVADSLAAISRLQTAPPELVVLDLMMPRFTGVDVVRFIRSQRDLAGLPVIVLSNCYLDSLAEQAAALGVSRALLKIRTTPALLHQVIQEVTSGQMTPLEESVLLAAPTNQPPPPQAGAAREPAVAPPVSVPASRAPAVPAPATEAADFRLQARADFLAKAPVHARELRQFYSEVDQAAGAKAQMLKLENLYRKVHFTSAAAGLAECQRVALMASAFEAFLFELAANPSRLTASAAKTMRAGVEFIEDLLNRAAEVESGEPLARQVLVVDDDLLSCRLAVSALRNARLDAQYTQDPRQALQWAGQTRFALLLLDFEMPGMNGIELCRQVRLLPGYEQVPVVFVTGHDDFEHRLNLAAAGGNDLISKPFFPIELAVKGVMHLLRNAPPGIP